MKIVCPTDFSPRAMAAARIAVTLARRTGGSVELVHVVVPPTADIVALAQDAALFDHRIREDAQERLAILGRELAQTNVPVTFHISEGQVESSVLERAKATSADLIVLASHARPTLERFVLGSVAEHTVRIANFPILVVPPGVETLGRPDEQGKRLRLVAALDGRPASAGALDFVRRLRTRIPCDVTFLRLYWPMEEYQRLGLTGPRDLFSPDPDVVADLERTLRNEVGVLPGSGNTAFAVRPAWGEPGGQLLDFAQAERNDLVVMGAESRHGLSRIGHPAVANQVVHQASGIPVVFVPPLPKSRAPSGVPAIFTVLAPTDLSPAGNAAVPFAYALVAAHGGVVELCHVHERELPSPAYAYDRADGKLTPHALASAETELRSLIPPEATRLGINTHITVIDGGHAGEAIVQAAERLMVDSIVLGSHGKGAAARSLLGSVSSAVVHKSRRPVLVVPYRDPS